ncbi:Concanavalin A-like lectin/glucanases superfamily protein [Variovorax sp. CF079]|uniref:LamG domain-containing protein n=1 Tax=Variovorax sp. CF079 TaxID=1882774 RepID=UPI000887A680|nr:LamG domain-containing protein [Variovorax sp. CF079]SDD25391.1 Concanavalin A-like lectin/glucanases superfamily protein [Variovorax sp. CF079]
MTTPPIPPHKSLNLPGVHGYADRKSVAAGECVRFHVSSDRGYQLSVCQLGSDVEGRSDDVVLHAFAPSPARVQAIHPGSYVFVEKALDAALPLYGLTLECWVKPWSIATRQTLIGQYDFPAHCGWGLFIEEGGALAFYLGDGRGFRAEAQRAHGRLVERRWQHVAATWNGRVAALWIDGQQAGQWDAGQVVRPGPAPLRMGASGVDGLADVFLEADLAMPVLYGRALVPEEIVERHAQRGLAIASGRSVLACWPLREERGAQVADASGHQRTGRIVNHGTWMIVGPAFEPAKVAPSEDAESGYDPFADPTRGHGLRFASDDLYDCRWEATHEFRIPEDAKSGVYVGRIRFEQGGREADYDITFIVRKPAHAAPAPILVLCAVNSWLAYASTPFAKNVVDDPVWPRRAAGLENCHPEAPAYSSYTYHRAGQPCYQVGLRMPWPNASPSALYDPAGSGFSQWTRLERRLHVWLAREGYDFDVIGDIDLHRDPAILSRYQTVFVNGHSEYWSLPGVEGLDDYLRRGGSAIVLSGNTMYLRVSYDEDFSVMEQRKVNGPHHDETVPPVGPPAGPFGEQYHSQDWARGGRLKASGRPAADIIGLETAGWAFADGEDFGVYHVEQPAHALFNEPHPLGLAKGQTFGHAPGGGLPRAIGHEWDLTIATLARMTKHTPPGAALPAPQEGIEVIANGIRRVPGKLDAYLDYHSNLTESIGGLSAEMIYWERPQGGRVFHAGAVGAAWVIGSDPNFGKLLKNVLYRFGVQPRA